MGIGIVHALGIASLTKLRLGHAGPQGEFAERMVSLLDLAWAIAADDAVKRHGGVLDEQRVNRALYRGDPEELDTLGRYGMGDRHTAQHCLTLRSRSASPALRSRRTGRLP